MKISALLIALMFAFTVNAQEGEDMSDQEAGAGAGHEQNMEQPAAHQAEPAAKNAAQAQPQKKVAKKQKKDHKKDKQKM
jgi:hypothetical protein